MKNEPKKILLAEDDAFIMEIYAMKLKAEGYEVATAHDGEEAVQLAKKSIPNLIILDILMPKMDGRDVLKFLKSDGKLKTIPVVILTNVGEQDSIDEILKLGASDYLIKSNFTPDEVVEKVKKFI
jgi:CheY-like chemotaxis protein